MTDPDDTTGGWAAVAERVRPAAYLAPGERETYLRLDHGCDVVVVSTSSKGMARRLLQHPHFVVDRVFVARPDGTTGTHERPDVPTDEAVWRVEGEIPVGCLTVSVAPRDSAAHYRVVSGAVLDAEGGGDGDG